MRLEVTRDLAEYKKARTRRGALEKQLSALRSELVESVEKSSQIREFPWDHGAAVDLR